jgi:hypothetical protein
MGTRSSRSLVIEATVSLSDLSTSVVRDEPHRSGDHRCCRLDGGSAGWSRRAISSSHMAELARLHGEVGGRTRDGHKSPLTPHGIAPPGVDFASAIR